MSLVELLDKFDLYLKVAQIIPEAEPAKIARVVEYKINHDKGIQGIVKALHQGNIAHLQQTLTLPLSDADVNNLRPLVSLAVITNNLPMLQALNSLAVPIHPVDNGGINLITWCLAQKRLEISKYLHSLGHCADLHPSFLTGRSLLMYLVRHRYHEALIFLLKTHYLDLDEVVFLHDSITPLYYALREKDFLSARLLLIKGADPNFHPPGTIHPVFLAVPFPEMLALMIKCGASLNCTLPTPSCGEMIDGKELVLHPYTDSDDMNKLDQFTPLHLAVEIDNTEAIELLLLHGASTTAVDGNNYLPIELVRSNRAWRLLLGR